MKIPPVGAELSHADGRTDGHSQKLVAAFYDFAKARKKTKILLMVSILICMDSTILCSTVLPILSSATPQHVYFTYFNCVIVHFFL